MTITNLVSFMMQHLHKNTFDGHINLLETRLHNLQLDNNLDVYLILNPSFKDSEAMLTVEAGSICDPYLIPGLSNLVKNVIFSGSEKYPGNSDWNNFQLKNGGSFTAKASFEKITFHSTNADYDFEEALDIFSSAIAKPLIREEDCRREIKWIDYEWKTYVFDPKNKVEQLIQFFTDQSFQENRFTIGNKKSLNIINIDEKAKNFHSKFFRANKMKLVLKSKLPLDEMIRIADQFNCVPIDSHLNNNFSPLKKFKGEENKIDSLLDRPVDIKFKEEYRGQIIKFYVPEAKNSAQIFFRFPSSFKGFTSIHLDYLEESISQHLKMKDYTNSIIKDIQTKQINSRRSKGLFILLEFAEDNCEDINTYITIVYNYFQCLRPDKEFFEAVKIRKIKNYWRNANDFNTLQTFSDNLFLNSKYDIGEYEIKIEYDEMVFIDLFAMLANIKNWIVFVPTTNSNLSMRLPDFPCLFSYPFPIELENSSRYLSKKSNVFQYKKVENQDENSLLTKVIFPEVKPKIVNFKLKHGEYTLISESDVFGDDCQIGLTFSSPAENLKNFSYDLFNYALVQKIKDICYEKNINCELNSLESFLCDNNLTVKIKKNQVPKFFEILKEQIKNFKLSQSEIQRAKNLYAEHFESVKKSGTLDLSKMMLPHIIKKFNFYFERNKTIPILFNQKYYLMITAIGNIDEEAVLEIYESLKSTGERTNYDQLTFTGQSFPVLNKKTIDNSLLVAYHVYAGSKIKEFALVNLLKIILSVYLNEQLKYKESCCSEIEVEYVYIRQQAFLTFSLKTSNKTKKIKNKIRNFMSNYSEIINRFSEDLKFFKKTACRMFEWKVNNQESLYCFTILSNLIGVYKNDLQSSVKDLINSITIEELKNLDVEFKNEPFSIHECINFQT